MFDMGSSVGNITGKVKVKLSLCITSTTPGRRIGEWRLTPRILDLGTGQIHAPAALPPGKEAPVPIG
jgi:hypothetical protein